MLRVRQRLTQAALSARAGVSRQAVSLLECGHARRLKMGTVESILSALGARMEVRVLWNGPELDRLMDAGHAAIGARIKQRLERWGWIVRVEVSYSRYGERGRMDLLAWHPAARTLLVVEIKTELVDVQSLLGSLDVKARLGRHVAEQFGWDVRSVVPAIVFSEGRTTRRHLVRLDTLFDRFNVRGRKAVSWLRQPTSTPAGVLWFVTTPSGEIARTAAHKKRVKGAMRLAS
jgi:transcriptional regulator with XRE-family HTH domain